MAKRTNQEWMNRKVLTTENREKSGTFQTLILLFLSWGNELSMSLFRFLSLFFQLNRKSCVFILHDWNLLFEFSAMVILLMAFYFWTWALFSAKFVSFVIFTFLCNENWVRKLWMKSNDFLFVLGRAVPRIPFIACFDIVNCIFTEKAHNFKSLDRHSTLSTVTSLHLISCYWYWYLVAISSDIFQFGLLICWLAWIVAEVE